jgi:hypothetical protein
MSGPQGILPRMAASNAPAQLTPVIPGQLDVDEVLEHVVRNERHPQPAALTGPVLPKLS